MNSRSKQVLFLLMLTVAFFILAGLTLWHVNERFTAESDLEALQVKWEAAYGDGRYDELKAELSACETAYADVLNEIEQLKGQQQSANELILTRQKTVQNILDQINDILVQNGYDEAAEEFEDLKQRFEALNKRYEALQQ